MSDTFHLKKFYLLDGEEPTSEDYEENMWARKLAGKKIPKKKTWRPRLARKPKTPLATSSAQQRALGAVNG
jgi:hypothetical protein